MSTSIHLHLVDHVAHEDFVLCAPCTPEALGGLNTNVVEVPPSNFLAIALVSPEQMLWICVGKVFVIAGRHIASRRGTRRHE